MGLCTIVANQNQIEYMSCEPCGFQDGENTVEDSPPSPSLQDMYG